ncbi:MAG: carbohydrate ABC transporter permease [Acutalibacteraceae bacterium]
MSFKNNKLSGNKGSGALKKFWSRYSEDYLFMLPYLLIFFTFVLLPVLISVVLSFTRFDIVQSPSFIGIKNYLRLFIDDSLFPIALKNTLLLALVTGPLGFLLSLLVAWLLNELGNRTRSVLTLFFYAPVISGGAYSIWQIIYSGDTYGFLNGILINMGLIYKPIQWLTDSSYMMGSAMVVLIWMSFGSGFLSFIAGFKNVDSRLYEAAAIDGIKNRFQEMWYITLPSMKPQLMFGAVMSITSSFGTGTVISAIYGFPSTNYAVYTLVHLLEDYGNVRYEMGYASAIATVLFAIMLGSNLIVQRLLADKN